MHILALVHRYAPAQGGAERYVAGLASRMVAAGHQVTMVTTDALDFHRFWDPTGRRLEAPTEMIDGVRVKRFPISHIPFSPYLFPALRRVSALLAPLPGGPWLGRQLSTLAPYLPAMQRWATTELEDNRYDLVWATTITLDRIVAIGQTIARRQHIPLVVCPLTHLGAGQTPGSDRLSRYYTLPHQQRLVLEADGVIALTQTEKGYYTARGKAADSICVAPPGIDSAALDGGDGRRWRQPRGLAPSAPMLLSISSMAADKGSRQTVEAARRLWGRGVDVTLVLAGHITGPFRHYFDQLPAADRDRILLLGPVSEAEKRDLLAAADIFCMPSRTESFGIVYLEAWFYALPVIGANTWGVKNDVIDPDENGLLVDFGDAGALADAVERLLKDPALRRRLGIAGQKKLVERYNWDRSYRQVVNLMTQLVD